MCDVISSWRAIRLLSVAALAVGALGLASTAAAHVDTASSAIVGDPNCATNDLPANDDGSTAGVSLPFTLNFFGAEYSSLWVNNNGNVTFTGSQSTYTPYTIDASIPPMIAAFFADVDTRGVGTVTYGTTTFQGFPTFCVDWTGVGYFNTETDLTNTFQLLLVTRPDVGNGAFDVIFNYGQIEWETGDVSGGSGGFGGKSAGAGFSNGDGDSDHFYEMPGSLEPGSFPDDNPNGLVHGSVGSDVPGRYVFHVRSSEDGGGDIDSLDRDFPSGAIGYKFANERLNNWEAETGLGEGDVLRRVDLEKTFSDWDSTTAGGFLWWNHERRAINAIEASANGGVCFGLAISGGRFDSGLDALASGARTDGTWHVGNAYALPQPTSHTSSGYNQQFLRMVADDFATQYSVELQTTLQRQHDAFSDPTSGYNAFRNQLVSVLAHGKNLYDPSGKLSVPSGNGYGVVTLQVPSRGFGHGVLAYSARVEDDGTLDIGIWDNNLPNKPHTLKVLTDGTWTYDGGSVYGTVFSGALSMSASSKHDQGLLGLLPLYQPTGLSFQPGSVENSSIGGGTFVDLPPGATVSAATDDSGRPVDIEPLLADGFGPAGEIVNLPTGVGELDLTGAGSLDIRGNGVYMTADTDASGPSTLLSNEETGMISVTGASADLAVARSSLLVQSSGAQQLGLSSSNSVSFTGSGHAVTVVAAGNVDGSQVTATLYSGKPAAGTLIEVTPGRVAHAIKRAVFHVSRPTVKPGGAVRITGSTGFAGGRVALEELTHKHWRRLASVPIRHGTFSFAVKHLGAGKHTFRVARRHVHSKALVVTVP